MFGGASILMPVLPKLADLFKAAIDGYADLRAAGKSVDAEVLALLLQAKSADWDPSIKGVKVLADPETKAAGCRFLAGVAFAVASKGV